MTLRLTTTAQLDALKAGRAPSANKYRAERTEANGVTFDSKREAARYAELNLLQCAGEIEGLEYHRSFAFVVNGVAVGKYTPDFCYRQGGALIVEDVKSKPTMTTAYRLRKRLMLACFGVKILETT